jgi:type IV pilus assembly protein PilW
MKSRRERQQGLSLVELLVAMVLGLLLTAGALEMMLSSRNLHRTTDSLSRIQENGRFALDFLNRGINMAGYKTSNVDPDAQIFNYCGDTFCSADGSGVDSDQIAAVQTADSSNDQDCLGNTVDKDDAFANVYYINEVDNISSLYCRGYNITDSSWISSAQPLVDGIENMQVLYGINDNAYIGGRRVEKYVSATNVSDWSEINTIRIALLVNNGLEFGNGDETTRTFQLLDGAPLTFTDKHDRQVYISTIALSNVIYNYRAR